MPNERWLVTGAGGQLGSHAVRQLDVDDAADVLAVVREHTPAGGRLQCARVDLGDLGPLRELVAAYRPTYVLHLGAMTAVGDCHADPEQAERVNVAATRALAEAAGAVGARLLFSSTDMVFDGEQAPYGEDDPPAPLSHYGRTKVAAEGVLAGRERTLVVRLPLMYGFPLTGRATTFVKMITALRAGQALRLFTDEFRTPLWLGDAARALIGLARSDLDGLIHVAGPARLSRYDMIAECATALGLTNVSLEQISRCAIEAPEPRPADLSLRAERFGALFPDLVPGPIRAEVLAEEYDGAA